MFILWVDGEPGSLNPPPNPTTQMYADRDTCRLFLFRDAAKEWKQRSCSYVPTSGVTFSPRPRTHPRNIGYGLRHVSYAKAESVAMPSTLLAPLFDREHSADGWIFVLCQNMGEPVEEKKRLHGSVSTTTVPNSRIPQTIDVLLSGDGGFHL